MTAASRSGSPSAAEPSLVEVGRHRLEVVDLDGRADLAPLVFLHEGLGCVALWRSFPQRLAAASGRRAVVYSRAGYGRSDPAALPRPVGYLHDEALDVLPALLERLGVARPVLVGHSDGASIALVHAGAGGREVTGVVALAPHVFVEDEGIERIEETRRAYLETDLRRRLARYHADPDAAFFGWNDVWLSPAFRTWDITAYLPEIKVPVLVLQGRDDGYGTERQVEATVGGAGGRATARLLDGCGHSPHLERPDETLDAIVSWLGRLRH